MILKKKIKAVFFKWIFKTTSHVVLLKKSELFLFAVNQWTGSCANKTDNTKNTLNKVSVSLSFSHGMIENTSVSWRGVYWTFIYCCRVQMMDLQSNVTRRWPWSSASSWPAQPGSDGETGPSASSHTACRTSWCKRDCIPDKGRGEMSIMQQTLSVSHKQ